MNDLTKLFAEAIHDKKPKNRYVVRLTTSCWHDKNGLYMRKSIRPLKRQCTCDFLLEDSKMIGADEIFPRIINLEECEDGVYDVVPCNEHHDYWTDTIEDYDYKLVSLK